jgi:hypothetical protein
LGDKALAKTLGENGLTLVSQRYDFDQYIRDLEAMFEKVVAERRAGISAAI